MGRLEYKKGHGQTFMAIDRMRESLSTLATYTEKTVTINRLYLTAEIRINFSVDGRMYVLSRAEDDRMEIIISKPVKKGGSILDRVVVDYQIIESGEFIKLLA